MIRPVKNGPWALFVEEKPRPLKNYPRRSRIRSNRRKMWREMANTMRLKESEVPGISGYDSVTPTIIYNTTWKDKP